MHELFTIPEIVTAILLTDTFEHRMLQNCLLVSRLFSHEATRVLWARCGTSFPLSNGWLREKLPTVHDLAKITAKDTARGQYYANQIRQLRFVRDKEDWEGQWCDELLKLEFPLLEAFTSDSCANEYPDLGPLKMKSPFYTFDSNANNELFYHILKSSPKLKALDLMMDEPVDKDEPYHPFQFLEEEAIRFINATPILSSLSLPFTYRTGFEVPLNTWSPAILSALGSLPSLHKLCGQILTSASLSSLPPSSFPALRELDVKFSGPLSAIPTAFPHLSLLKLELQDPSTSGLGSLGALGKLEMLDITFAENEENSFSASDLLAIAHGCPRLHTLNIPSNVTLMMENPCPVVDDISDSTIEELASALPNLQQLCIGIENRDALTHSAIISLANHCPALSYFSITADVNMRSLISGLKELGEKPLSEMSFMRLYPPEDSELVYDDLPGLAQEFWELAPGLNEFSISDGESGRELGEMVEKLIGYPGSRG
jgi:hypothetical protein